MIIILIIMILLLLHLMWTRPGHSPSLSCWITESRLASSVTSTCS